MVDHQSPRRVRVVDDPLAQHPQIPRPARRRDGAAGAADGAALARRGDRPLRRLADAAGVQRVPRHDPPQGQRSAPRLRARAVPALGVPGRRLDAREIAPAPRRRRTPSSSPTRCCGKKPVELELRPLLALRPMHELSTSGTASSQRRGKVAAATHRIPPTARTPEVFFAHDGDAFDGASATRASRHRAGTSTRSTAASRSAATPGWKTCGRPAW